MRKETGDWVSLVAKSILAAIATDAAERDHLGPFTLDDFLRAWIERDSAFVDMLPEPPDRKTRSATQTRTYWFYAGCHMLEETARIAEVGDGKFIVASLPALVSHARAARDDAPGFPPGGELGGIPGEPGERAAPPVRR